MSVAPIQLVHRRTVKVNPALELASHLDRLLALLLSGAALRDVGSGSPLRVDGHDHVYVFPYVSPEWSRDVRPVDVYSATGERLFAGLMSDRSWVRVKGDSSCPSEVPILR